MYAAREMIRTVRAARYVLPFREGGSVPALMEADDLGMYVVKLGGAAQGKKALVAELVCGEIGRSLGLAVPEIVFIDVDRALADGERDPEIAEPLERSAGINVGLDYLPGSITFDPGAGSKIDPGIASRIVLFDAFVANVDRTPRNPNLLRWHDGVWLIDHGAALWFHHGWSAASALEGADDPFADVKHHVLLPRATALDAAALDLKRTLATGIIEPITAQIPDDWLDGAFGGAAAERAAYSAWFTARSTHIDAIVEEAHRAQRV
ncbi:hypothetical protein BH09MYX1_BH09MYX1_24090 [soil metagenome]